jgi:hypothetical protein
VRQEEQPQQGTRTGVFAFGTNDYRNPQLGYEGALRVIDNAVATGINPVIVLPNANDRRFADVSAAVRKAAEERGVKFITPQYDPRDPLHITQRSAQDIAKQYPGALVAGDSNSVRLAQWGYGHKTQGNSYMDPSSGMVMGRVGAPTSDVAKWMETYRRSLEGRKRGGSIVSKSLMLTSKKAASRRGRPD